MASDEEIELQLASRLRLLRQEHSLTLATLAEQSGISAPHLSRLEKGERQPSIGALLQLARCYGMTLSRLVGEDEELPYHLIRSDEGVVHRSEGVRYRVLSGPGASVSILEGHIDASQATSPVSHEGFEWLQVKAGAVDLAFDSETITLKAGDSIQFDAGRQHWISCRGKSTAKVLLITNTVGTLVH